MMLDPSLVAGAIGNAPMPSTNSSTEAALAKVKNKMPKIYSFFYFKMTIIERLK
jgi:hypothetical protein